MTISPLTSLARLAAGMCCRVLCPSTAYKLRVGGARNSRAYHGNRPRRHSRTMASSSAPPRDNDGSACTSEGEPLLKPAGLLFDYDNIASHRSSDSDHTIRLLPKDSDNMTERVKPPESDFFFIPQVNNAPDGDGGRRKRVLVLCTGGTLTMAPNPDIGGALSPVPGALTDFMKSMLELTNDKMPEVVVHEYSPLLDSADMGPLDWQVIAGDIKSNYLHFDGFVVISGTDTMAYAATGLSFILENLGKPIVFTGSQVPIGKNGEYIHVHGAADSISHSLLLSPPRAIVGQRNPTRTLARI